MSEFLERRVMLTTITTQAGNPQTFTFESVRQTYNALPEGHFVEVQQSGDTSAEYVGSYRDELGNIQLTNLPGVFGNQNASNGGFGGVQGTQLFGQEEITDPIIPALSYTPYSPAGTAALRIDALAIQPGTNIEYGINVNKATVGGVSQTVIQIIEFSNSGDPFASYYAASFPTAPNAPFTDQPPKGEGMVVADIVLPGPPSPNALTVDGIPPAATNTSSVSAAAFNPVDGRLYFVVVGDGATKLNELYSVNVTAGDIAGSLIKSQGEFGAQPATQASAGALATAATTDQVSAITFHQTGLNTAQMYAFVVQDKAVPVSATNPLGGPGVPTGYLSVYPYVDNNNAGPQNFTVNGPQTKQLNIDGIGSTTQITGLAFANDVAGVAPTKLYASTSGLGPATGGGGATGGAGIAQLYRIDLTQPGLGTYPSIEIADLANGNPNPAAGTTSLVGDDVQDLTWDPAAFDPILDYNGLHQLISNTPSGAFVGTDAKSNLMVVISISPRPQGLYLFSIFVAQGSLSNSIIAVASPSDNDYDFLTNIPAVDAPSGHLSPYLGDSGDVLVAATGLLTADGFDEAPAGSGYAYLGLKGPGLAPITSGTTPGLGLIPAGTVTAGLKSAFGAELDEFLFGGTVTGDVDFQANVRTFYSGWLITGASAGAAGSQFTLTINDTPTSGAFELEVFNNVSTGVTIPIVFDTTAAQLQAALQQVTFVNNNGGNSVQVNGPIGGPFTVQFAAGLGAIELILFDSTLTPAGNPPVTIAGAVGSQYELSTNGPPTSGTYTLSVAAGGFTGISDPISFNAPAADVETALQDALLQTLLPAVLENTGDSVFVSGADGGPYVVQFDSTLGAVTLGLNSSSLSPAVSPAVFITAIGVGLEATNDLRNVWVQSSAGEGGTFVADAVLNTADVNGTYNSGLTPVITGHMDQFRVVNGFAGNLTVADAALGINSEIDPATEVPATTAVAAAAGQSTLIFSLNFDGLIVPGLVATGAGIIGGTTVASVVVTPLELQVTLTHEVLAIPAGETVTFGSFYTQQKLLATGGFFENGVIVEPTALFNKTFATPQYLGALSTDNPTVSVSGGLTSAPKTPVAASDDVNYYAVSLLAGQTITVELSALNLLNLGVFDPDGRLIATDYSDNTGSGIDGNVTINQPFQFKTDRPGSYRFAVAYPMDITFAGVENPYAQTYVLQVGTATVNSTDISTDGAVLPVNGKPGDIALGGVYVGSFDSGSVNVTNGDLGAVHADANIGNPSPAAPVVIDLSCDLGSINDADGAGVNVAYNVPVGSIGLLRASGALTVGALFLDPTILDPTLHLPYLPAAVGTDIQIVQSGGLLFAQIAADFAIGTIQAGSLANTPAQGFSTFAVNPDNNPAIAGRIDLIDCAGDFGTFGEGGPHITTGPNGDVGFINVGGTVYEDSMFGQGTLAQTLHDPGAVVTLTDDGGGTLTFTPVGTLTANPAYNASSPVQGVSPFIGPQLELTTYGIRGSGGVVVINVTVLGGGLTIATSGIAASSLAEVTNIVLLQPGPDFIQGLPANGSTGTTSNVGNPSIVSPTTLSINPPTGGNTSPDSGIVPFELDPAAANSLTVSISGSNNVDVFDVSAFTDATKTVQSTITSFINNTAGELVNLNAAAVGILQSDGSIGITHHATPADLYPALVISNTFPFLQQHYGIVVNGPLVQVSTTAAVGNILVNAGSIGSIVADSGHANSSTGSFLGINAPIVVQSADPLLGVAGQIQSVDIGQGILPSGSGAVSFAGLYAVGIIGLVANSRSQADIRGTVVSNTEINAVELSNSSIIHATIAVVASFVSTEQPVPTVPLPGLSGTQETPIYTLGQITVHGNGGILGASIFCAGIGPTTVSGGYGIFFSSFNAGDGDGQIAAVTTSGYGIRGDLFEGGATATGFSANGDGSLITTNTYNSQLFVGRESTTTSTAFDPYFGLLPSQLTDLDSNLQTSAAQPNIPGRTDTGAIEDSTAAGDRNLGYLSAQSVREVIQQDTFGNPLLPNPNTVDSTGFGTAFDFANSIGSVQVRGEISGLELTTGRLGQFSAGTGKYAQIDAIRVANADPNPTTQVNAAAGDLMSLTLKDSAGNTVAVVSYTVLASDNDASVALGLATAWNANPAALSYADATVDDATVDLTPAALGVPLHVTTTVVGIASLTQFTRSEIVRMGITVAGTITNLVIHGDYGQLLGEDEIASSGVAAGDSFIQAIGPHGNIKNLTIQGNLFASVLATGAIGNLTVFESVAGNITAQGESRGLALGVLHIGAFLDQGSLNINGSVGSIIANGGFGVAGDFLTITGNLNNLTVGALHSTTDNDLGMALTVDGNLGIANIRGRIDGSIQVNGNFKLLRLANDGSNQSLINGTVHANGSIGMLSLMNGNIVSSVTAGRNINKILIANGSLLASGSIQASTGAINSFTITGGSAYGLFGSLLAANSRGERIDISGDLGDGTNAALVTAFSGTTFRVRGSINDNALVQVATSLSLLEVDGSVNTGAVIAAHPLRKTKIKGTDTGSITIV